MTRQVAPVVRALALAATGGPVAAETVTVTTHIDAPVDEVWGAVRDVYAVERRLVPGMVSETQRDGDVRIVTFANGFVVKERIVSINDAQRRMAYSAFGGKSTYHAASMQVVEEPGGCRIVWITDFLPAELKPFIGENMRAGSEVMKRTLEKKVGG